MKTQIIIAKECRIIKEYDFLITLGTEDVVEHNDIEYRVDCCLLNLSTDTMIILLKS